MIQIVDAMLQQNKTKTKLSKLIYPKNQGYIARIVARLHAKDQKSLKGLTYTPTIVYNVLNGQYQDLNIEIALKEIQLEDKKTQEEKLKKVQELDAQLA